MAFLGVLWTAMVYLALSPMLLLSWWLLSTSKLLTWAYRQLVWLLTGDKP